jgi:hypothetical protein
MPTDDPAMGRRLDPASVLAHLKKKLTYFESVYADPTFQSRAFADNLCLEMGLVALQIDAYARSRPEDAETVLAMKRRLEVVHYRARRRRDDLDD